jgi:23S rRNA (guanosine2251-2'-O)-methyltransferase
VRCPRWFNSGCRSQRPIHSRPTMRPPRPTRSPESPAGERSAAYAAAPRPAASALLAGIHSVREALRAERALDKVLIAKGSAGPRIQEIVELCRALQVPVRFEPREALDRATKGVTHQGVVGFGAAHKYLELRSVAENAQLLVVLDGVEDPHNLGAIVRTAHAVGAAAVVVGERRSAPLTETVSRAAAGALEHLPVARVTNISRALEELKQAGYWIYGLDERGATAYDKVDFAARTVLVLGAEGAGLHENVRKHCDLLLQIPMAGAVSSLNVSVAAGVVLFEWRRRRSAVDSGAP